MHCDRTRDDQLRLRPSLASRLVLAGDRILGIPVDTGC
jgi:hypothetical protein